MCNERTSAGGPVERWSAEGGVDDPGGRERQAAPVQPDDGAGVLLRVLRQPVHLAGEGSHLLVQGFHFVTGRQAECLGDTGTDLIQLGRLRFGAFFRAGFGLCLNI